MGGGSPGGAEGSATKLSTFMTIIANLVGAGLLSLPYTYKRSGLLVGVLAACGICALNAVSMVLIARCCDLAGVYDYLAIVQRALGRRAGLAMTVLMGVYCMGSCVSFLVLLADFGSELMCEDGCTDPTLALFARREVIMTMSGALILQPLALPRSLSALKYTSSLSTICIFYVAAMIGIRAIRGPVAPSSEIALVAPGVGWLAGLPITAVSFTLHYNAARYYYELKDRSLAGFSMITGASFGLVLVLYLATAIGGYLLFGSSTAGDVLSDFANDDTAALVARIALAAIVICCYPLAFAAMRRSVIRLLPPLCAARLEPRNGAPDADSERVPLKTVNGILEDGEDADVGGSRPKQQSLLLQGYLGERLDSPPDGNVVEKEGADEAEGLLRRRRAGLPPPICCDDGCDACCAPCPAACQDWRWYLFTKALVIASVLIAISVPGIEVVLGYKGALGGSFIVYIFPGLMHFALVQQAKEKVIRDEEGAQPAFSAEGIEEMGRHPIWVWKDVCCTYHGWLAILMVGWGAFVLVSGTLSTSGVI